MKASLLSSGVLALCLASGPSQADVDVGIFFSGAAIHGNGFSLYFGGPYSYAPYRHSSPRPHYRHDYYRGHGQKYRSYSPRYRDHGRKYGGNGPGYRDHGRKYGSNDRHRDYGPGSSHRNRQHDRGAKYGHGYSKYGDRRPDYRRPQSRHDRGGAGDHRRSRIGDTHYDIRRQFGRADQRNP